MDLQVFLRLDLLLQAIHLHMQFGELLVQLLVILNDRVRLLLLGRRYRDGTGTSLASNCRVFAYLAILATFL